MPLFRAINLPTPLLIQSVALTATGLYTALFRKPVYFNPETGYSVLVPANAPPRTADTISAFGVASVGLQGFYLVTSYMPLEDNQFVHASVPIRLCLSLIMFVICIVHRKNMSPAGFLEFSSLAIFDGTAATLLGFYLGRFDGMVKNAERWL